MKDQSSLDPEAADTLRRIRGGGPSPIKRGPPPSGDVADLICLECGHLNAGDAWLCAECRAQLYLPSDPGDSGYLKAADLLRSGQLDPGELRDLLDEVWRTQSFYTAGTRYSVFG